MKRYEIKYKELDKFLRTLDISDFEHDNGRESKEKPSLKIAKFEDEIERFKMDKSKITLDSVVFYGMPFLIDAIGNDLSICTFTKRKYKLKDTGRVLNILFDKTIIGDCSELYGTPLNNCWAIPERFLIKIK